MNKDQQKCPECSGSSLYTTTACAAGHLIQLLPGLGSFWRAADIRLLVCGDCGLARFYVERAGREKLPKAQQWTRL